MPAFGAIVAKALGLDSELDATRPRTKCLSRLVGRPLDADASLSGLSDG